MFSSQNKHALSLTTSGFQDNTKSEENECAAKHLDDQRAPGHPSGQLTAECQSQGCAYDPREPAGAQVIHTMHTMSLWST